MKILERRDPKKKQKWRKIEPLPFLRSSYSAAEIPKNKDMWAAYHVLSRKTQFQIPYFHTFFNQWDCFDETTILNSKRQIG